MSTELLVAQIGSEHHLIFRGRSIALVTDVAAVEAIIGMVEEAERPKRGRPATARTLPKPGTKAREVLDTFLSGPRLRGDLDATAVATLRRGGLLHAVEHTTIDLPDGSAPAAVYGLTPWAHRLYEEEEGDQ